MKVQHFPTRSLVLKESTIEETRRLGIGEAVLDASISMPPIPPAFSIRNEMTEVEDQGSQGSCTSFCVTACLEHMHQIDLSEAQMIHEAEKAYGDCQEGLALIHGYQSGLNNGLVIEKVWPYDDNITCWTNPPNTSGLQRYKFSGIGHVYNRPRSVVVDFIKAKGPSSLRTPGNSITAKIQQQMLARRKPVSLSVPVVWSAWPWNGVITMPSTLQLEEFSKEMTPPNTSGWHCLAICGWDSATGRFIFKNSWGRDWGDQGYGTIPYQYIELYSDVGMIGW